MSSKSRGLRLGFLCGLVWLLLVGLAFASEYHGQVFLGSVPVPGATVVLTNGSERWATVTDRQGLYEFRDVQNGAWKIHIEMRGFATIDSETTITPETAHALWQLKLLDLAQILAQAEASVAAPVPKAQSNQPSETSNEPETSKATFATTADPLNQQPDDEGLLVNGSVNNASTSPFSLPPGFGNHRPGSKGLYTGGIGAILDNSAFDARPDSLTGLSLAKPAYNQLTGLFTLGGPLRIPHVFSRGPTFFAAYQRTRDRNAITQSGLVPNAAERNGDLSGLRNAQGQPVTIYNPATGLPFSGPIPISPQAQALLNLYPLPNVVGAARYNYQTQVLDSNHVDAVELRLDESLNRRDQLYGGIGLLSSRADNRNLFHFRDTTKILGIDTRLNWSHLYGHQLLVLVGYRFTRLRTLVEPEFANRQNISGLAGIMGNDQQPSDWGPPTLVFTSGVSGLNDATSLFNRNRTDAVSAKISDIHWHHTVIFGGDFRKQEFNEQTQQNPRGVFTFTGGATSTNASTASSSNGSDLADFLLGIPDASTLAFGNAKKYFRESVYDAFVTDDWRMRPKLSMNLGLRWEYGSPISELFRRLVNLDALPGFSAVAPVVALSPRGPLTGQVYPSSLIRPDRRGFQPRVGVSWRPIAASTLVV
ncbi:MAG: carboxypeptidase regulatory-like domain-containing protein, partial [Acidobacteria bacterium]|nr:carboxypeptidase regulatory-like domain-containing protein [Acidobacteriota bacterium]